MQEKVQVGCRLIVPFGARKMQTALVVELSTEPPDGDFVLKEAIELLDTLPVVLPQQLRLWQWMADYYLCSMGDLLKAAMPSGMKLESESLVTVNPDCDADQNLSPAERQLLEVLEQKPQQRLADLQKQLEGHNALTVVKRMLEKGLVVIKEEVRRTYRARTISCVRLTQRCCNPAQLEAERQTLTRAPKQLALLDTYLSLSKANAALRLQNMQLLVEVERAQLLEKAETSSAVLTALKERGILETYDRTTSRLGHGALPPEMVVHPLNPLQQAALESINRQFQQRDIVLLQGVTGSGKTEIYIHLIRQAIERGEQVLYLLPEIVLTAQLVERLRRVFGDRLGVYHSKYPDAERVEVWQKQLSDHPYDIIVGVRSSVFLPFQKLGLVIIDEEHESSYKQQDPAPRYHARSTALMLARQFHARTLMGTATPSVESYHLAQQGRYGLVQLAERYSHVQLPVIQVVDIKDLRHRKMMTGAFSPQLLSAMQTALQNGEQTILFLNRRGFATQVECHECGWTPRCQHCDVSLTYHRYDRHMTCHYCGAVYDIPLQCPQCQSTDLTNRGYGTERIEEEIQQMLPQARVARMDLDTTRSRRAYEQIIADFQRGKTDILVGTQMVTKGLDFDHVRVVGILNADTMTNLPDFRSYERAFQMMVQVAGRAGRRQQQGLVILQTRDPENEVITQVCRSDYQAMYQAQIDERQLFRYPPFSRLIYIYMKHKDEPVCNALAQTAATQLRRIFGDRILGPDTPAVGRVQSYYIRKIILKLEPGDPLADARQRLRQLQQWITAQSAWRSAQIYYDVDPV